MSLQIVPKNYDIIPTLIFAISLIFITPLMNFIIKFLPKPVPAHTIIDFREAANQEIDKNKI
jgi:hypothetical protein